MKPLTTLATAVLLLGAATTATAVTLEFDSLPANLTVGEGFSVDVRVGNLGADYLSSYSFEVLFDSAALSFASADFGNELDVFDLGGNPTTVDDGVPGIVTLSEISFDSDGDLAAFQADDFVLATLNFTARAAGASTLSFDNVLLVGDGFAAPLTLDAGSGQSVTVTAVPLPAVLALMGLGLAGLALPRRR